MKSLVKEPKISVIMGVYNCEKTLEESINSLINQTCQDFEIIICDDGSIDSTLKIANKFKIRHPDKILLLANQVNQGLNFTLNKCLKVTKGQYIARMDGDDISLPDRFAIQSKFLDQQPEFAIVSSAMIYFDENGDWGLGNPKEKPEKKDLIHGAPFAHAASMVRKKALLDVGGYSISKRLLRVEDYHLWIKMYARGYIGYNLQYPLYKMRDDKQAANRRDFNNRINEIYVKFIAIKLLDLPVYNVIYTLRPLLVGLLPNKIYSYLHRKKMSKSSMNN